MVYGSKLLTRAWAQMVSAEAEGIRSTPSELVFGGRGDPGACSPRLLLVSPVGARN